MSNGIYKIKCRLLNLDHVLHAQGEIVDLSHVPKGQIDQLKSVDAIEHYVEPLISSLTIATGGSNG